MTPVRPTKARRLPDIARPLALGLALAACGGDATGPGSGNLTVTLALTADTVQSERENAIHVKVTSNGKPVAKIVTFHVLQPPVTELPAAYTYIAIPNAHPELGLLWQEEDFISSTVDGDAWAWVQLGSRLGPVQIEVRCEEVGVRDTVSLTILPGQAVRTVAGDTAVTLGNSVQLHGDLVDRFGNRRGEPVTYTGASGNIQVSPTGVVSGTDFGVGQVIVSAAGLVDTGHVSVVPDGEIAAYRRGPYSGDSGEVVLVRLDGSNRRIVARPAGTIWVDWWGSTVAYDEAYLGINGLQYYRIRTASDDGRSAPVTLIGLINLYRVMPRFSSDGAWIYYYMDHMRRVHPDGSGDVAIGPAPPAGHLYWEPSPSPDDTRLAIVSNVLNNAEVLVLGLAADTVSSWRVQGSVPAWSPAGDLIAYLDVATGALRTVAPDGTGDVQRSLPGAAYLEGTLAWTADGSWLVAEGADSLLHVVRVASGLDLPLPYSTRWTSPARHR